MKSIHIDFTQDILRQLELMVKKMTLDYHDGFITNIKLHEFIDDVRHITENNDLFKSQNLVQSGGKLQNVKDKPKTMKERPLIHKEPKARKPKTMKEKPKKPLVDKEPILNHTEDELHYIPALVMSKEKFPHIVNNIEKVVTLSYDNDPYTYNRAIVEYVNSPNSDVVLCMGSFKLTGQDKPKKMSKVTFRRIIILFFASILATTLRNTYPVSYLHFLNKIRIHRMNRIICYLQSFLVPFLSFSFYPTVFLLEISIL